MRRKTSREPQAGAALPSVDEVLNGPAARALLPLLGRERVLTMVRALIAAKRVEIAGREGAGIPGRVGLTERLEAELAAMGEAEQRSGVRRVINATGVVVHTNLGRAPLSPRAIEAMKAASGYAAIEYDLAAGSRGSRGDKAVSLLKLLTGAEDALVVNNCAAAALLALSVFARGREVIVSRGELVEIGGDFRIPDILAHSGAVLREVGTTNRTHLRDYESAISERTSLILKVHPSNFRITGFTKTPGTAELAELARASGLTFYEDAGSGALADLAPLGISGEPVIREVVASGADIVSFSGDKLLGGPQSGIVVGREEEVERLRRDPLYRALRADKTMIAALEATLESYARGTAAQEIPVLRMLSATADEIGARSASLAARMRNALGEGSGLHLGGVAGVSAVGGGAAPDSALETALITLEHLHLSDTQLEEKLRSAEPPIISRIESGRVLLDLRTVAEEDEVVLIDAIVKLFN